ncbi:MAG: hypothetical protein ACI8ZO_000912 [Flavobacteriales bacterium]|jgi:hypothetical protein
MNLAPQPKVYRNLSKAYFSFEIPNHQKELNVTLYDASGKIIKELFDVPQHFF